MIQEFIKDLKKGEFRITTCTSCAFKVWPPTSRCPRCLSKTSLKKIEMTGILLEFTRSHVKGSEGIYGIVEIDGIKLVGSFGSTNVKEGMKVRMSKCELRPDGAASYSFEPVRS
jgi:uncharacterized OB-fold protein